MKTLISKFAPLCLAASALLAAPSQAALYRLQFGGTGPLGNTSMLVETTHASQQYDADLGLWWSVSGLFQPLLLFPASAQWFLRFYTADGFGGIDVKTLVNGQEGDWIFMGMGPVLFTGGIDEPYLTPGLYTDFEDWDDAVNQTLRITYVSGALPEPEQPPVNVPEPATLAVLGLGLIGLGTFRRRRTV